MSNKSDVEFVRLRRGFDDERNNIEKIFEIIEDLDKRVQALPSTMVHSEEFTNKINFLENNLRHIGTDCSERYKQIKIDGNRQQEMMTRVETAVEQVEKLSLELSARNQSELERSRLGNIEKRLNQLEELVRSQTGKVDAFRSEIAAVKTEMMSRFSALTEV